VNGVAFSLDGTLLASPAPTAVRLWNPATRRLVSAPLHATSVYSGGVHVSQRSADGTLLGGGGGNGTVRLWNPATRAASAYPDRHRPSHRRMGAGVQPQRQAAGHGCDGTVRLWNPATGHPVKTLHATTSGVYGVRALAFSPTASCGHRRRRRHRAGVEPGHQPPRRAPLQTGSGPADALDVVAFSPDGKLLVAALRIGGTVLLWHVSLFAHTYAQLCADAGPPTPHEWNHYASGEPHPKACAYTRTCCITQNVSSRPGWDAGQGPPRSAGGRTGSARSAEERDVNDG
jgi:WD40 repeat protein